MFVCTPEEKQSIRFVIDHFKHHYKTDAIYTRIENDKLTKADWDALENKIFMVNQMSMSPKLLEAPGGLSTHLEMLRHTNIAAVAFMRYKSYAHDSDKS